MPFDQPFHLTVPLAVDGPDVPFDQVGAITPLPARISIDNMRVAK